MWRRPRCAIVLGRRSLWQHAAGIGCRVVSGLIEKAMVHGAASSLTVWVLSSRVAAREKDWLQTALVSQQKYRNQSWIPKRRQAELKALGTTRIGMLEHASGHRADILEGRFVIGAKHADRPWEVIVEPDELRNLLVVITAYPVEQL